LATLHYCFHTKEELFLAVFEHLADQLADQIVVAGQSIGLGKATTSILNTTVDWFVDHQAYALAQIDLYLWAMRQRENGATLAVKVYDIFTANFTEAYRAAQGPDDDPDLAGPLASISLAILDGLLLDWSGHGDRTRLKADVDLASESLELLVESRRRQVRGPCTNQTQSKGEPHD
jgi:AcrR family transcriptional regulator